MYCIHLLLIFVPQISENNSPLDLVTLETVAANAPPGTVVKDPVGRPVGTVGVTVVNVQHVTVAHVLTETAAPEPIETVAVPGRKGTVGGMLNVVLLIGI